MDKKNIEVSEIACFVVGAFLVLLSLVSFESNTRGGVSYYFPDLAKLGIAVGGALVCLGFLVRHWRKGKSE